MHSLMPLRQPSDVTEHFSSSVLDSLIVGNFFKSCAVQGTSMATQNAELNSYQGQLVQGTQNGQRAEGPNQVSTEIRVLKAKEDKYDGMIVDTSSLPDEMLTFLASLRLSLKLWENQNKKGIWLKLPLDRSNLVHPALQEGFRYHHAETTYVMLVIWLSDLPSTIPANASHQVGVGAFVLNDKNEVLAVQEKCGTFGGTGIWKMPTGSINQGEDISAGAVREVEEETGIATSFVEVIGFRQAHTVAFEKSDLFFLCVLRPLTSAIIKQDSELTDVQWMPLAEYRSQGYLQQRKLLNKMLEVCIAKAESGYEGFGFQDMQAGSKSRKPQYFYYNKVACQG